MKSTEYKGELFSKDGETYTKFTIGSKVINSRIEKLVICLGGKLIKQTKTLKYYEVKGNQIHLLMVC